MCASIVASCHSPPAQVNPQDIDQISIGQPVSVNFSAFAANTTPRLDGQIYRIAADLTQENAQTLPYFEVRISMNEGELEKLGDQILKPGMPAEAYIQTFTRSAKAALVKYCVIYSKALFSPVGKRLYLA